MARNEAAGGMLPWVVAAVIVLLIGLAAFLAERRKPAQPEHARLAADYGNNLLLAEVKMSESTSLSGGKSTFIDGQIKNNGNQTVTAATVQVVFNNDGTMSSQTINLPLTLIRTHDPYVDTMPLSVSPLKAGEQREFRLIFEDVSANWDQNVPRMQVMQVYTACNPCG